VNWARCKARETHGLPRVPMRTVLVTAGAEEAARTTSRLARTARAAAAAGRAAARLWIELWGCNLGADPADEHRAGGRRGRGGGGRGEREGREMRAGGGGRGFEHTAGSRATTLRPQDRAGDAANMARRSGKGRISIPRRRTGEKPTSPGRSWRRAVERSLFFGDWSREEFRREQGRRQRGRRGTKARSRWRLGNSVCLCVADVLRAGGAGVEHEAGWLAGRRARARPPASAAAAGAALARSLAARSLASAPSNH